MTWIELIILAVIQGVAEFLPISSSGHLVIVEALLSIESNQTNLNIALHFGTLLSILVFYRRRIVRLFSEDQRVIPLLVVGTIPAGVVGLTIKFLASDLLHSALLAGMMLPITGLALIWCSRKEPSDGDYKDMSFLHAFLIGVFQACALLPGISRSGFTISAGLMLGQSRSSAATFSFLLAIPAILGATTLEFRDVATGDITSGVAVMLLVGVVLSFVVGIVSLAWLVRLVENGKIQYFAYWCIPLGLIVIAWQLLALANS